MSNLATYEPYKLFKTAISCNVIIACSLEHRFEKMFNDYKTGLVERRNCLFFRIIFVKMKMFSATANYAESL